MTKTDSLQFWNCKRNQFPTPQFIAEIRMKRQTAAFCHAESVVCSDSFKSGTGSDSINLT